MKNSSNFIILLLCAYLLMCLSGCSGQMNYKQDNTQAGVESSDYVISYEIPDSSETNSAGQNENMVYSYDSLQKIFIGITSDTTKDDISALIADNNLSFTVQEYNKVSGGKKLEYKLAYSEGSARQRHSEPGDYLEIVFDEDNDYRIMSAHYVNEKNVAYSALFYNYGTWHNFNDNMSEDYTGYYINDILSKEVGIIIKYTNGNEKETHYFNCGNAEEAIRKIIDKIC